jgi:hypothetical protein
MPPSEPERDAVARTLAAMLMASQIKRGGQVHPETILTEIGALAGFAAQISIRRAVIERQGLDPDTVLVEVVTKNGERYYFSDLLNAILFENETAPPYCIWSYVTAAVPQESRMLLPDVSEIVSFAARTIGTRLYGVPRLPPSHMPHSPPRAALDAHWRLVQSELIASGRDPAEWPFDLAQAAQWQMYTSRDTLALPLAAAIVMEAAIPMSKIDPQTVLGALRRK